jgi:hypothetical protein
MVGVQKSLFLYLTRVREKEDDSDGFFARHVVDLELPRYLYSDL